MGLSKIVFVVAAFLAGKPIFADENCRVAQESNPDIITCSQASYVKIDKVFNDQYKALVSELDAPARSELLSVQRIWIKFRGDYCEDEGDAGGGEAPINSISCRTQLTSFRLNEIIYLRTGVIGDGFYKAVSLSRASANAMSYGGAIKITDRTLDFGTLWTRYARENCAMVKKMYSESLDECMARMRFQLPIY